MKIALPLNGGYLPTGQTSTNSTRLMRTIRPPESIFVVVACPTCRHKAVHPWMRTAVIAPPACLCLTSTPDRSTLSSTLWPPQRGLSPFGWIEYLSQSTEQLVRLRVYSRPWQLSTCWVGVMDLQVPNPLDTQPLEHPGNGFRFKLGIIATRRVAIESDCRVSFKTEDACCSMWTLLDSVNRARINIPRERQSSFQRPSCIFAADLWALFFISLLSFTHGGPNPCHVLSCVHKQLVLLSFR
ncbi:hypothetical protein B0O80DRAFT_117434 [Mortierella sp. GBAus27b]|nr:hypothetical protein B0O80DRAFT_117434 [Mortierella sp. GBAus27b]